MNDKFCPGVVSGSQDCVLDIQEPTISTTSSAGHSSPKSSSPKSSSHRDEVCSIEDSNGDIEMSAEADNLDKDVESAFSSEQVAFW